MRTFVPSAVAPEAWGTGDVVGNTDGLQDETALPAKEKTEVAQPVRRRTEDAP